MDKWLHSYKVWDEIDYPFPNFNGATVEVWERINNFTPHLTGCMVTNPCWVSVGVSHHWRYKILVASYPIFKSARCHWECSICFKKRGKTVSGMTIPYHVYENRLTRWSLDNFSAVYINHTYQTQPLIYQLIRIQICTLASYTFSHLDAFKHV